MLSGTPSSTLFEEPLLQKGHTLATTKGKAAVFMEEYEAVNHLGFNKEERECTQQLKPTQKSPNVAESCCAALRKGDLNKAILQIRTKGTPGAR